jgi:molybdate transport system substrate-binding protein
VLVQTYAYIARSRAAEERVKQDRSRQIARLCACSLLGLLGPLLASPAGAEILVAAAVSLREPLIEISRHYRYEEPSAEVRFSFGASSALGAQIRFGAPIDVFISADERIVDDLEQRGLVAAGSRFALARNRLVVLRSAEFSLAIEEANDLVQPAVRRFAVAAPLVPVGRYAREWLRRRGLLQALGSRIALTEHARAALAAVDLGHADLAIVYATDARIARSARIAWEIPDREQPRIIYTAARISARTEGAAETERAVSGDAFLAFLRAPGARAVLAAAGFQLDAMDAKDAMEGMNGVDGP